MNRVLRSEKALYWAKKNSLRRTDRRLIPAPRPPRPSKKRLSQESILVDVKWVATSKLERETKTIYNCMTKFKYSNDLGRWLPYFQYLKSFIVSLSTNHDLQTFHMYVYKNVSNQNFIRMH
jgi:hypothetical protein